LELGFKVPFKIRDSPATTPQFKDSAALKLLKDSPKWHLRQVCLDFKSACSFLVIIELNLNDLPVPDAVLLHKISTFDDKEVSRLAVDKIRAAERYVREYYFEAMFKTRSDVVYSVALSDDTSNTRPPYAFSDVVIRKRLVSLAVAQY
jgi:hypothetical protein